MADLVHIKSSDDRDVGAQGADDDALIRTARARFQRSEEAEAEIRREFLIDQRFRAGGHLQWPDGVINARELDQRPAHTVNLIPGAIAQITNEQRKNRPSLRVSPAGGGATVEVAAICDGLLRHIQRDSRAPIAYDVASAEAAGPGRGWFRVITEYENPRSFSQKLSIMSIPNAMSVFPQPYLREPDYSDMNWCFVIEDIARDDFLSRFEGVEPHGFDAWAATTGDPWVTRDTVRVADYYYRTMERTTIVLLSDGSVVDLEGAGVRSLMPHIPSGVTIIDRRVASIPRVHWCKINGQQVLERTAWLGSWIPVIPVIGDMFYVNGQVRISGVIRDSRDPQTMVNYWETARTEAIALAPRAPWLMAEGQDEGLEHEWDNANRRNLSVLHYKDVSTREHQVPPPSRNVQEPAIQALSYACESAKGNFQATTRIYDASYGAPGNERSGIAIAQRDKNADMSNSHYNDNLGRSLHHLGRILLELLPLIYDEPGRVMRIIQDDDTERMVTLNQPYVDEETGLEKFYSLKDGTYAVQVVTGPSFASRRQEAFSGLSELARYDPKIMQVADDIVIGQSDIPGAKDIAARLKKTIPPDLLDAEGTGDKDAQLAQTQSQMQRFQQEAQAINAHAEQLEGQAQHLAQENASLKSEAQWKMHDVALRREDAQLKAQHAADAQVLERAKLELEAQKLRLDEDRLELERAKLASQVQPVLDAHDAQAVALDTVADLQVRLAAFLETTQECLGILMQDAAQRAAPKTITMARTADGALVGTVRESEGASAPLKTITMARGADGGLVGTVGTV